MYILLIHNTWLQLLADRARVEKYHYTDHLFGQFRIRQLRNPSNNEKSEGELSLKMKEVK